VEETNRRFVHARERGRGAGHDTLEPGHAVRGRRLREERLRALPRGPERFTSRLARVLRQEHEDAGLLALRGERRRREWSLRFVESTQDVIDRACVVQVLI